MKKANYLSIALFKDNIINIALTDRTGGLAFI